MKIYHYDPATLEFVGSDDANPNPLEKGQFLIPACATDQEPPTVKAGFKACFVEGAWIAMPDARGLYYSTATGLPQRIETLGELPPGLTKDERPTMRHVFQDGAWILPPPTLEERKQEIDQEREAALGAGVAFNGRTFYLDDRFTLELLGMIMGLQIGVMTGAQRVRTMNDGAIVSLDLSGLTALAAACGARRREIYEKSWADKAALQ